MDIIKEALKEDIGREDITTKAVVQKSTIAKARIIAKEKGIIAGLDTAKEAFKKLDKRIVFIKKVRDGDFVRKGKIIAELRGNARAILTAERVALNFLQRLSGIATLTRKFVKLARNVEILDTRKTIPCLRKLEKYAVRVGGGHNHRSSLEEAVLVKDNHIKIAGSVKEAAKLALKSGRRIEVEARNMNELKEAIDFKADTILLDNMPIKQIKEGVKFVNGRAKIEVSGGVNLGNVAEIARTGIDYISIGALTHSANALDISLEIIEVMKK